MSKKVTASKHFSAAELLLTMFTL